MTWVLLAYFECLVALRCVGLWVYARLDDYSGFKVYYWVCVAVCVWASCGLGFSLVAVLDWVLGCVDWSALWVLVLAFLAFGGLLFDFVVLRVICVVILEFGFGFTGFWVGGTACLRGNAGIVMAGLVLRFVDLIVLLVVVVRLRVGLFWAGCFVVWLCWYRCLWWIGASCYVWLCGLLLSGFV